MYVDACRFIDTYRTSLVLTRSFPTLFVELNNKAWLNSQLAPGISCLYFLSIEIKSRLLHPLGIYMGSGTELSVLSLSVWMEE